MQRVAEIRVLYADTDQMGIVNNINYLRYFEIGRCEWIRLRGRAYKEIEEAGHRLPVVEAHIRYRESARYDDLLEIEACTQDVRAASLRFAYAIRRKVDHTLLCEGSTLHACLGIDGKLRRLPDDLLALLRP